MAGYSYKAVTYREDFAVAEKEWIAESGQECDGDPGYNGDYWLVTAHLLEKKDSELHRLRAENERLQRVNQRLESENQTMSLRLNEVETRLWELEHGKNCACPDCAAAPHGDLLG